MDTERYWSPEPIIAYKVFLYKTRGERLSPMGLGNTKHYIHPDDYETLHMAICTINCGQRLLSTENSRWEALIDHPPHMAISSAGIIHSGWCGWHSFDTFEHAVLDFADLKSLKYTRWYEVELLGTVVQHESGYRSQFMRLKREIAHWEVAIEKTRLEAEENKNRGEDRTTPKDY